MNNFPRLSLIFCILSGCTWASTPKDVGNLNINDYYGKAALFEFCSKAGVKKECNYVNHELHTKKPEIFFFENEEQTLVIYQIESVLPYVVLAKNKDGYTEVISRGLWLGNKGEFVKAFLSEGNFSE